ncbi:DNA-deoxyinosine glycosylase [Enterococcus olivae]
MENGLAPIYDERTEILILGSAPSEQSLKKRQYYGNPSNQFWKTVFQALAVPDPKEYSERLRILKAHKIGLWDVYSTFQREGSMDHHFKETQLNQFDELLKKTSIKKIIANGKKASEEIHKQPLFASIPVIDCSSTSGANNGRMQQRLEEWSKALSSACQALYFGNDVWIQAAAFHLRFQVFVLEQKIPLQWEFDTIDEQSAPSLVLFEKQQPIATIRYQAYTHDTIQPDRFCVAKKYRRKGIGRILLEYFERQAIEDGYRFSRLSAEKTALSFYQKLGYETCSEPFEEDGILCIRMQKQL